MAHRGPAQLARLVRALAHPAADVFIHLDSKTDYQPFIGLTAFANVRFTRRRFDVQWGGFSQTETVLEGMREILGHAASYDVINVLSGQDYPIKPTAAIHEFFARHPGQSFMECQPTGSAWWEHNQSRFTHYHLTDFAFPGRYLVQRVLNWLLPRRRMPLFPVLYGGNMGGWYALSRACAAYVVGFVDEHSELRRFGRFTWGSDEFLVNSILLNSPLAASIVNNNLRYIDWSAGLHRPKTLTHDDLPRLVASARLYARKFDLTCDAGILDELDDLNR